MIVALGRGPAAARTCGGQYAGSFERSGEGRQRRPRSDTSGGGARAAVEMTRPFRAADADARQRRAALSACGAGRASTTIRAEAQSRRPDERFGSGQFDHPGDGQRLEGTRGARAACSRPWGARKGARETPGAAARRGRGARRVGDHPGDDQRLEGTRGARAACSRPWGGRRGPARRRARPRGRGSPFAGAEPFAEAGFAMRACRGTTSRCSGG